MLDLSFQGPSLFTSSTVSIQRSSPDSDSCEESVVNQMTSGSSPVTMMDTLSCTYAGHRVTYCLQFRTDECQSAVAIESVEGNNQLHCNIKLCVWYIV